MSKRLLHKERRYLEVSRHKVPLHSVPLIFINQATVFVHAEQEDIRPDSQSKSA